MLCREAGYGAWGVWRAAATWELKASEGEVREAHAAVRAAAAERRVLTMVGLRWQFFCFSVARDDASFSGGYPLLPLQAFKVRAGHAFYSAAAAMEKLANMAIGNLQNGAGAEFLNRQIDC